jgi:hypothetical protein
MTCEYNINCEMKAEDPCCFEGKPESCPLWRDFSTKAKQKDIETHYINRRVRLPDMDLYKDDALLCEAINKMGR